MSNWYIVSDDDKANVQILDKMEAFSPGGKDIGFSFKENSFYIAIDEPDDITLITDLLKICKEYPKAKLTLQYSDTEIL